ncbi:hypothetical protein BpHYR1_044753 [Brachionus plicatilis]|uniref:Uncharacterized protein n=1 Tax=Brachionus plicatilis TaxID=10195 RepID=A0A3M7Q3X8_BRAPC|nr:hypothetical protein BpHYR1_044753 [Brachionus plicatilis]
MYSVTLYQNLSNLNFNYELLSSIIEILTILSDIFVFICTNFHGMNLQSTYSILIKKGRNRYSKFGTEKEQINGSQKKMNFVNNLILIVTVLINLLIKNFTQDGFIYYDRFALNLND